MEEAEALEEVRMMQFLPLQPFTKGIDTEGPHPGHPHHPVSQHEGKDREEGIHQLKFLY